MEVNDLDPGFQRKKVAEEQVSTLQRVASRVVDTLVAQGVTHVFGVPGAKIDAIYDALTDAGPEVVVCRHEQNAAFMAAAVGRLTGVPGVALVTSGPGTSNLVTGLLTANTEQDPVVAICGAVPRADRLKRTHQSMDASALLAPVTKYTGEVDDPAEVVEVLANAFRIAMTEPRGAAAVVLPADVAAAATDQVPHRVCPPPSLGAAPPTEVARLAEMIGRAERPVLLIGGRAADAAACRALHGLIAGTDLPVVETFQAAGVISRELESHYLGRVGLFRNQPGDRVIARADLVVTIGFDPIEYDPGLWNRDQSRSIAHIDAEIAMVDNHYAPEIELRGSIPATLNELASRIHSHALSEEVRAVNDADRERLAQIDALARANPDSQRGVNPAALVLALREHLDDDATVACDVGSVYIYMARHFRAYQPRRLLFSNGQQTLGVGLPWAMAAALVRPGTQVVSVSGDGGFLFSAQELETAARLGLSFTHVIFRDDSYDMVGFQEELKYGRRSGVALGDYDTEQFAAAFGARGRRVSTLAGFVAALTEALAGPGRTIIDVWVDYTRNTDLGEHLIEDVFH